MPTGRTKRLRRRKLSRVNRAGISRASRNKDFGRSWAVGREWERLLGFPASALCARKEAGPRPERFVFRGSSPPRRIGCDRGGCTRAEISLAFNERHGCGGVCLKANRNAFAFTAVLRPENREMQMRSC